MSSDRSNDIKLPMYGGSGAGGDDAKEALLRGPTNGGESGKNASSNAANGLPTSSKGVNAANASQNKHGIWPGYIILIWIAVSGGVILQNAYILRDLQFNYPIFLVTYHLIYATIGTRILRKYTRLLDGVNDIRMSWDQWFKTIVPIGALFSASLIFSNLAYLSLSVAFIQMLKAFMSVAVLGMSILAGLEKLNPRTFVIVSFISFGVALASYGEIAFDATGFVYQALGIAFEAARLVSIQKLLHGVKMSPLVSVYFYAPVCACLNALLIPVFEGWAPFEQVFEKVGLPLLILNGSTAFALNCAVVFLIGAASSLVLTLSGIVKDILLVVGSVVLMGATVTMTQLVGYTMALAGLFVYKQKAEVVDAYVYKLRAMLGR